MPSLWAVSRAAGLLLCLHGRRAAPVEPVEPHTCTSVELVHTNLGQADALAVLNIYHQASERHGPSSEPIARMLMAARGGFWDVMMIGTAFSYSILCSEYVELASVSWNVLLCKEAEDEEAMRCGAAGLTRHTNGTLYPPAHAAALQPDHAPTAAAYPERPSAAGVFSLQHYANYMVDDLKEAREERVPVVRRMLDNLLGSPLRYTPHVAETLRRELIAVWPEVAWNVLVEVSGSGHYYYSEEQFNFDLTTTSGQHQHHLSVAIFDRRCDSLQRDERAKMREGG